MTNLIITTLIAALLFSMAYSYILYKRYGIREPKNFIIPDKSPHYNIEQHKLIPINIEYECSTETDFPKSWSYFNGKQPTEDEIKEYFMHRLSMDAADNFIKVFKENVNVDINKYTRQLKFTFTYYIIDNN